MIRKFTTLFVLFLWVASLLVMSGCSQRTPYATSHTSKARHKATMRTYHVRGHTYHPTYVSVGDTMRGISSWYGPNFHGKYTSNGEVYNMHRMTAAHKTWPMDTLVKVENLTNGRSVIVRINDRGPFVRGRIIDCSYAAGKKLGLDRTGIAKVKLTVLGFSGKVFKPKVAEKRAQAHASTPVPTKPLPRVRLSDFGVQVGAFRNYEGAVKYKRRYHDMADERLRVVVRRFDEGGAPLYRVWVMGFGSEDEAMDFIRDNDVAGGFLVRN
jgi:rare lipoprotein A